MKLCDLGPLARFLKIKEKHRLTITREMLVQVAKAVKSMHFRSIVHGSLKCRNILVKDSTRQAKLIGFHHSFQWNAKKSTCWHVEGGKLQSRIRGLVVVKQVHSRPGAGEFVCLETQRR